MIILDDNLMIEARNLIALSNAQTPLLGGENTSLASGTGFEGATPKHMAIQTPNPMATPMRGSTFGSEATPFKTPREEKIATTQRKRSLLQALASLPKPRNEWEIKLPDMDNEQDKAEKPSADMVEDMSDYEREMKESAEAEAQERLARRSLAVQRGLPRPTAVPVVEEPSDEIEQMIHAELIRLLEHDAVKYPVAGGKVAPGTTQLAESLAKLEDEFDSATLDDARKELDAELKRSLQLDANTDVKQAVWERVRETPTFETKWNQEHEDLLFSAKFNRFMTLNEMDDEQDMIQGLDKTVEVRYIITMY
jgi:pre-mRNA-splicing factor CDC5/CEF1